MDKDNLQEESLDENESLEAGESEDEGSETSDNSSESAGEETAEETKQKKNKSNFKALNEALKIERQEKKALLEKLKALDPKSADDVLPENLDKGDLAVFMVENPDAATKKAAILGTIKKFNGISLADAWEYVKATTPKESQSKTDASFTKTTKRIPKDISQLSEEEALALPNSQYLKWARATGRVKN